MRKWIWMIPLAFFLTASPAAWALTVLKGREAAEHVGDARSKFTAGRYTYEILTRSHRDAMNGRFSDAVIFNADGGAFSYPRRKHGDHAILLDDPAGREEEFVTDELWRKQIGNTLSDDNPMPNVVLDDSGKELAIVYIGKNTRFESSLTPAGLLQLVIKVEGDQAYRSTRRRGM